MLQKIIDKIINEIESSPYYDGFTISYEDHAESFIFNNEFNPHGWTLYSNHYIDSSQTEWLKISREEITVDFERDIHFKLNAMAYDVTFELDKNNSPNQLNPVVEHIKHFDHRFQWLRCSPLYEEKFGTTRMVIENEK